MAEKSKKSMVPEGETLTGERYFDVYHEYHPDPVFRSYQEKGNIFTYECENGMALKVEVETENIFRFRYAPEGVFEDGFSYALDPAFGGKLPQVTIGGDGSHYFIHTSKVFCRIDKEDLKVSLYDAASQNLICKDDAPYYCRRTMKKGTDQVKITKAAPTDEAFFGMGDKTHAPNLRGHKLENWNTDSFSYKKEQDPLYRAIPFYYAIHKRQGYGIFLNNSHRTHFDFDSQNTGTSSFWADGGEMDYFFIYGPALMEVAERYMQLTGRPELPPIWALGFHQCRWSYYPESRVRELAQQFRDKKIPCDAIYLDIDYMDGYRCFTWNKEHFPNPKQMIADLGRQGFHTVVMIDPGIRVDPDYAVYKAGMEKDAFCYRSTGEIMRGPVWPPDCVFPDYTRPEVREWWGKLYRELYNEHGVSGFWNDMNEPAVFKLDIATFPDNVLHHYEGYPCDHRKAHNIYGQQMSRATYEGLKHLKPDKRPFVLTRASFSGGQRFASVWTGDNAASWEHLRLANIQCQRLSASGFSFVGTDIGGFDQQPDGELFVRWLQLGAFHPLYRVHSMGNNIDGAAEAEATIVQAAEAEHRIDQEPWSFGEENTALARQAIEFRYQLLPYLYTAFRQNTVHGRPVIGSLFLYNQEDPVALQREEEFMFGSQLLAMPVLEPGIKEKAGYLPTGRWYDYWTGTLYEGKHMVKSEVGPGSIPVFAKAGAIIPNYPVHQHTGEQEFETIYLRAYYGQGDSELYEDNGDGYGYAGGTYSLRRFHAKGGEKAFRIEQEREGNYVVSYRSYGLQVFGLPFKVASCSLEGEAIDFIQEDTYLKLDVPADFQQLEIRG